jgi:hypothetical protein
VCVCTCVCVCVYVNVPVPVFLCTSSLPDRELELGTTHLRLKTTISKPQSGEAMSKQRADKP